MRFFSLKFALWSNIDSRYISFLNLDWKRDGDDGDTDLNVWEDNWDDDASKEDDFSVQLK